MPPRPAFHWIGNLPTVRTADVRASIEYERKRTERPAEANPEPRKDHQALWPAK